MLIGILVPSEKEPILIGFIDEDKTEETELFQMMIESGEALDASFLDMQVMTKEEAETAMEEDDISLYFSFPEGFTESLYEGNAITVPLIGNPNRPMDSFLVKELLDSLTRYIATSQASILTINDYAKELNIEPSERGEMLFDNFIEFTMFVLGKGNMIKEKEIENVSTASPLHYYLVAGWFIAFSIWLLGIYILLETEESKTMRVRYRMFGVTYWQQLIAKMLVTIVTGMLLAGISFIGLKTVMVVPFYPIDYVRIFSFLGLYGVLLLQLFSLIKLIVPSEKGSLFAQTACLLLLVIGSGALIPTLYFPTAMQAVLPYIFSYDSFQWLVDLIVLERNYATYTAFIIAVIAGFVILAIASYGKERFIQWEE